MKHRIKDSLLPALIFCAVVPDFASVSAQTVPILAERIAVTARPSADSITLRWAPLSFQVWHRANTHGYRLERYTLARDGELLPQPEKVVLAAALRPAPEASWETVVSRNRYAAIAAQAFYGERFEVDLARSDIFTIVNKARENEQRYAFALFSADMAPAVARASGLWFSDKAVRSGDRYLYRVVVNSLDSLRGSIYISPADPYVLPAPQNLSASIKNRLTTLRWDRGTRNYYTAYTVERSEDGVRFIAITDTPLVSLSSASKTDNRYEYAVDTIHNESKVYHYRVRGLTPFGEQGPPSATASARAVPSVSDVPYITAAQSHDNKSITVQWTFPGQDNAAIKGFSVARSSLPGVKIPPLTPKLLPPSARSFEDHYPQPSNYYRVTAHGVDGEDYSSHVYFAQLVDSIPPEPPSELLAKVNDDGQVRLSWKAGVEPDIYGYRVYKAFHRSEELTQVTTAPSTMSSFTDTLDLNTLNEKVYYSVMAVDEHQNQSQLSEWLEVPIPDKVKPMSPVFLPIRSDRDGISIRWTTGGSDDIVQYRLFRKSPGGTAWKQIQTIQAIADTTYHHHDSEAEAGQTHLYTVVSVDDAGLESEPAKPVAALRCASAAPAVEWKKPLINPEESLITLSWRYDYPGTQYFRIYRSIDGGLPLLLKTLGAEKKNFTDAMIPGRLYSYRIMALFSDGNQSVLSEEVKFHY